jgi:hypothetical protein
MGSYASQGSLSSWIYIKNSKTNASGGQREDYAYLGAMVCELVPDALGARATPRFYVKGIG